MKPSTIEAKAAPPSTMSRNRNLHLDLDEAHTRTYPNFAVAFGVAHRDRLDRETVPDVEADRSDRMVELNGVLWLLDAVQRGDPDRSERTRRRLLDYAQCGLSTGRPARGSRKH
jgi:hypothetical protein